MRHCVEVFKEVLNEKIVVPNDVEDKEVLDTE